MIPTKIKFTPEQLSVIAAMCGSGPIMLLEFRNQSPEVIKYFDKKGQGKIRYMTKHNFSCEHLETGAPLLAELYTDRQPDVPEDMDAVEPPPPEMADIERGTRIIAVVGGLVYSKGTASCKIKEWHRLDGIALGSKTGASTATSYPLKEKAVPAGA